MKQIVLLILLLISAPVAADQLCDLAPEWRQHNWSGSGGRGSCGHASTISALRWVQEFDKARVWKQKYENGENFHEHLIRLHSNGIPYIETHDGDTSIFRTAAKLRRMVVVYWPDGHVTNVVGIDATGHIYDLDNNHPQKFDKYQERDWYDRWQRCSGCAFIILSGDPPPPIPEQ